MSYQVLARKWRPRSFQQMVGQEHVLRMLMNALDTQRLHHAYLFTGTRGVGKTTLARLLAKCLNCETGVTSNPCNTCGTCSAIDGGRFLDLLEIDAASRTKVEDTRELLENVQYAPTQGRYKVYLIDEVHMLSGHSFNALLKTLEEPPAHVIFLLATTDPKRLPITILSRCLQFNLKRVPVEQIAKQLATVCTAEQIHFEMPALEQLAQAADGSMRDALSLMDQAIAFCGDKVNSDDVRRMLGTVEQEYIFRLLDALANNDGNKLLAEVAALAEQAPDFNQILESLLSTLHQLAIAQAITGVETGAGVAKLAKQLAPEDVQLYYQIALLGRRDLPLAASPLQGFEMVMLRMLAFHPASESAIAKKTSSTEDGLPRRFAPRNDEVKNAASAVSNNNSSATSNNNSSTANNNSSTVSNNNPSTANNNSSTVSNNNPSTANNNSSTVSNNNPSTANNNSSTVSNNNPSTANNNHSSPVIARSEATRQSTATTAPPATADEWTTLLPQLGLGGMTYALASNCAFESITENGIFLSLSNKHSAMLNKKAQERVEEAVEKHLGKKITVNIKLTDGELYTSAKLQEQTKKERQATAVEAITTDNQVQKIMDVFGATLDINSVKPIG